MRSFLFLCFLLFRQMLGAQTISVVQSGQEISLRGLSVVDNQVIWVSGSKGRVGRSVNGGKTWNWVTLPGMDKRDFRDIEGFSDKVAVIMAVDEPALILRTEDGGLTWATTFTDPRKGMFLDAMDFHGNYGMVVGDPIEGELFLAETKDQGRSWKERLVPSLKVDSGEACFAASGTNIQVLDGKGFCVVTGGMKSRLLINDSSYLLPLKQGSQTTGANSVAYWREGKRTEKNLFITVGGDFAADSSSQGNCSLSFDNGKTWVHSTTPPQGYKSCVRFLSSKDLIACGTSGVDISADGGMNWRHISSDSYHVVAQAKKGTLVVLAGSKGRISIFHP